VYREKCFSIVPSDVIDRTRFEYVELTVADVSSHISFFIFLCEGGNRGGILDVGL